MRLLRMKGADVQGRPKRVKVGEAHVNSLSQRPSLCCVSLGRRISKERGLIQTPGMKASDPLKLNTSMMARNISLYETKICLPIIPNQSLLQTH